MSANIDFCIEMTDGEGFEDEANQARAELETKELTIAKLGKAIEKYVALHLRSTELLRAVNKTGGVVVEYHRIGSESRPLRDWITELLNEIDGKETTK